MQIGSRRVAFALLVGLVGASLVLTAGATPQSEIAEIQLQLANELYAEGRYLEALDAYQRALTASDPNDSRRSRTGVVVSALRVAEFDLARKEAETLARGAPRDADTLALHGDALWSSGLFEEAETRYQESLAINPDVPRGRHGRARALSARSRLTDAMDEAQAALRLSPRDLERMAARAVFALARTGSSFSHGSGDYVIAFSTAETVRVRHQGLQNHGESATKH